MVSIKYETNEPYDCISQVTGCDLCLRVTILEISAITSFCVATGLLIFKGSIVRKSN